jgi:hypothetical protein
MKLLFPKRTNTHVTEAGSWRLLQSLAPQEWIVREVSERDYGIDAYIELVEITGHLLSGQLKGVRSIEWQPSEDGGRIARSPSVKTSTAAYWLGLPIPVFLFVADLSAQNIFFVPVKEALRRDYDKLASQETISFALVDALSLTSENGLEMLRRLYTRERLHDHFSFHITSLISHVDAFGEFIRMNQNRDVFIECRPNSTSSSGRCTSPAGWRRSILKTNGQSSPWLSYTGRTGQNGRTTRFTCMRGRSTMLFKKSISSSHPWSARHSPS